MTCVHGAAELCPQCLLNLALQEDELTEARSPDSPWSDPEELLFTPGAMLGERFRITSLIARGGMGEVYRADDLKLGQPVALKFVPATVSEDSEVLRRLYIEVRLGRQVAHPNVCRLYDLFEIGRHHFIVMEFVEGEDLSALLQRIGRLPLLKAIDIGREICAGLAACHEKEVIHGDLKPGNIIIDGRGRARITDFGLSRVAGERGGDRLIGGTLPYMAPEQLDGTEASVATDLYALGLILYEIFTGKRLHAVNTLEELRAVLQTIPPQPSAIARRIPPPIEHVILRCLEFLPENRPASARDVLMGFPGGDPIDAAVSAGETPTPEMVAAASQVGDLSAPLAWSILLAAALGLVLLLTSSNGWPLRRHSAVKSQEVLAERARELIHLLSFSPPPVDWAYWFSLSDRGEIIFNYRQSPKHLVPLTSDRRVSESDPPHDQPGMSYVQLDPVGRLRHLRTIPAGLQRSAGSSLAWDEVFRATGLNPSAESPRGPGWLPPVPHDEAREWRIDDGPLVLRAAKQGGRVVYLEVSPLVPSKAESTSSGDTLYLVLLMVTLVAGFYLARRNFRLGRVDTRGALTISGWVFFCRAMYTLLVAHHSAAVADELRVLSDALSRALWLAAQVWLAYMAVEPFIRRRWPRTIISWKRILEGRWRNPLVGRDLLLGAACGIALQLLERVRGMFSVPPSASVAVDTLSTFRHAVAYLFYFQARAIFYAIFALFLLLLLRVVVRSSVVAGVVWVVIATATWSRWDASPVEWAITAAQMALLLTVLSQFGLLAATAAIFVHLILGASPLALGITSWYFDRSLMLMAVVAALLVGGFQVSLAGKPLFGRRILEG